MAELSVMDRINMILSDPEKATMTLAQIVSEEIREFKNTRSCLKLNPITGTEATSSERRLTLRTVQTRRSNTRS